LLIRSLFRSAGLNKKERERVDGLFGGDAPLATFSSKIKLAFALGLITRKTRRQLDVIRQLRNDFAHARGALDFDDVKCRDRWHMVAEEWKGVLPITDDGNIESSSKKIGFAFAVQSLAKDIRLFRVLIERLEEVKQLKRLVLKMEEHGG